MKDFTSPIDSLSSWGLIFSYYCSLPVNRSLYNEMLSIPFPFSLAFEQEALAP